MLKHRILTSAVLAPAALGLVFYAPLAWFTLIAGAIVCLGVWEWSRLVGYQKASTRGTLVVAAAGLMVYLDKGLNINSLWQQGALVEEAYVIFLTTGAWWLLATLLVVLYPRAKHAWAGSQITRIIAGLFTLIPLWLGLNTLRAMHFDTDSAYGSLAIVFVLGIVWSADIGAYFSGKNFGKRKMMPAVSPNKTLEGLLGGLVAVAIFAVAFCLIAGVHTDKLLLVAGLSVVVAVFSAVGDLLESMFKREAGVKDSGSCLPGHGGILDRIDSLTAAVPLFILVLVWFNLV